MKIIPMKEPDRIEEYFRNKPLGIEMKQNPFLHYLLYHLWWVKTHPTRDISNIDDQFESKYFSIEANPYEALDYDASLFKDGMRVDISFPDEQLDNYYSHCSIEKEGDRLVFSLMLHSGENTYKAILNPLRMIQIVSEEIKMINPDSYGMELTGEETAFCEYEIAKPAQGNMAALYKEVFHEFEKLYMKSKERLEKEARQ